MDARKQKVFHAELSTTCTHKHAHAHPRAQLRTSPRKITAPATQRTGNVFLTVVGKWVSNFPSIQSIHYCVSSSRSCSVTFESLINEVASSRHPKISSVSQSPPVFQTFSVVVFVFAGAGYLCICAVKKLLVLGKGCSNWRDCIRTFKRKQQTAHTLAPRQTLRTPNTRSALFQST